MIAIYPTSFKVTNCIWRCMKNLKISLQNFEIVEISIIQVKNLSVSQQTLLAELLHSIH